MKKTSFLKKLTAMAATLAMTCVMAVGAFAAEPAVDYKLDSASISVGETWTMSVPAGGMYDWNLSSEYIAYGPSMADKEGVLKQVGYETANGVSTITYEAMMPGTCTVTLTDRSFAKIAEATVTVTDGSAAPDTPSVDTPSTDNKAAETPAAASAPSAAAAVSTAPVDTRTAQQREIDEAKANGTWGIEYTTCQKCGYHYAPAAGLLHALARCEEQLNAEFASGASRVFASEDLLRPDAQGRRALQDDLFVGLPDDPANVGVTVYSPALREGSYLARKQDLLRGCESLLGLRRGILSEVETPAEPRTATEIAATSVDYDLTIRDLQSAWTDTVQQAMALCSALGAVYGLGGLPQTAAPAIDCGDGVLYDRARIWAEQRELVDAGLLRPELALAWYFDLPHETEAELAEIRRRFMGDAGRAQ